MQLSSGKQERSNLCVPDLWCFGNSWHPPFPSTPLAIRTSPAPLGFAAVIAEGEEALTQSAAFQLPADSSQTWFEGEMLQNSPQAPQIWISTLRAAAPAPKAATETTDNNSAIVQCSWSWREVEREFLCVWCVCVKELIERQSTSTP